MQSYHVATAADITQRFYNVSYHHNTSKQSNHYGTVDAIE